MANAFLACPTYDSTINAGTSAAIWCRASKAHSINVSIMGQSLLAKNFNELWCEALNQRTPRNLKYFAMLHADIQPADWWLDSMIEELEKHDADIISGVVPIKDNRGVTSTAIANPLDQYQVFTRLTLRQCLHPSFPTTFTVNDACDALEKLPEDLRVTDVPRKALLINTGMWVCRFDRPWAEKLHFEIRDKIVKEKGLFRAKNLPEDWNFSYQLLANNLKVMATTAVKCIHFGVAQYGTTAVWGDEKDFSTLALAL